MCKTASHCNDLSCVSLVDENTNPITYQGPMNQLERWIWTLTMESACEDQFVITYSNELSNDLYDLVSFYTVKQSTTIVEAWFDINDGNDASKAPLHTFAADLMVTYNGANDPLIESTERQVTYTNRCDSTIF